MSVKDSSPSYPVGYTCGSCGAFVFYGQSHSCPKIQFVPANLCSDSQILQELRDIKEIIKELVKQKRIE
jgi:hypothetical protein